MNKECTFRETREGNDDIVFECSNCKDEWYFDGETPENCHYNYCPNCGARITKIERYKEEEDDD